MSTERLGGLIASLAAGLVVVTPLDLRAQAIFGVGVFFASLLLARRRGAGTRLALVVISVVVSGRYLWWRMTTTMGSERPLDAVAAWLLLGAELYTFAVLLLGYAQTVWPLRRKPVPLPDDRARWPTVDVFIPTYGEPLEVVRATVLAAQALDWPADKLVVHLLDDGRRPAFRDFAAKAGVRYHTRPGNEHAKAGNLNVALGRSHGELVAVFDCDHVPVRSFLQLAAGGFLRDPRLAFVQTPHHFHSPDPFERNLGTFRRVPNEGDLFYGQIQPGNDAWNAAFFCGSCAVIRRAALADIGGFAVETVTEDAHTALRMHRRGWRSAYLAVPQASGLATESLAAHVGQRIRWARGMAQIFRIDNPLLGRGLGLMQRLCYASAMLHFFYGLPRLVFLTAPVFYLLFGAHIFNAPPATVMAYALPHLAHLVLTSSRLSGRWRHSFWAEVYEAALAVYVLLPTALALVAPKLGHFKVTAKGGRTEKGWFDRRIALPYLILLGLNLCAFAAGLWRWRAHPHEHDVVLINLVWCAYDLLIIGATLAAARERRQVRAVWRVPVAEPAVLRLEGERTLAATTADLSMGGAALRPSAPCALRPGDRLSVGFFLDGMERPVPARVVRADGELLRVRFEAHTTDEERWVVRSLFGRADVWARGWTQREPDRPLRALGRIAGHALGLAFRRRSA